MAGLKLRDRILRLERVRAGDLIPDERNWRKHPPEQRQALQQMLASVGYVDALLAREAPEGLVRVDGHLRAGMDADQLVPVLVTDLSEQEAGDVLATFDPIAAMAEGDEGAVEKLLADLEAESETATWELAAGLHLRRQRNEDRRAPRELFGPPLVDKYLEVPVSVLNSRSGRWRARKDLWRAKIGDSLGRSATLQSTSPTYRDPGFYARKKAKELELGRELTTAEYREKYWQGPNRPSTSRFDPVLAEVLTTWYSAPGALVYNPCAGDIEPGYVAGALGRRYVGLELSAGQVAHNQALVDSHELAGVRYIQGDAREAAARFPDEPADLLFSCPPYFNLERYSKEPDDLSNMKLDEFFAGHRAMVAGSLERLADDRFAVWVVGDARGPDRQYIGFPGQVHRDFAAAGASFHAEMILVRAMANLAIRVRKPFEARRRTLLVHEHVLVFCKGDPVKAAEACGQVELLELAEEDGVGDD